MPKQMRKYTQAPLSGEQQILKKLVKLFFFQTYYPVKEDDQITSLNHYPAAG